MERLRRQMEFVGDYFYMEALMRLKKDWNPYW